MLDAELLSLLVCPLTKGELVYMRDKNELWSPDAGLAYAVRDGLPIMIAAEARKLTAEEQQSLK